MKIPLGYRDSFNPQARYRFLLYRTRTAMLCVWKCLAPKAKPCFVHSRFLLSKKQRKQQGFKDLKHKKSDRSTQIFSVYYGRSLECHTGSVDVSGSSPLCSTRKTKHPKYAWFFHWQSGREPRSGEIPETGKFQAGAKKFC